MWFDKLTTNGIILLCFSYNLEQQLSVYCQEHHLSINETIRLSIERLLTTTPLSPYELGKDSFGADQTHQGDIAQQSKVLLARYPLRGLKIRYDEPFEAVALEDWDGWCTFETSL